MTKMTKQSYMLKAMFDAVKDIHGCTDEEAFDIVLSYVAVNIGLEQQLTTLPMKVEAHTKLSEIFDADLLRQHKWDHFGTLYNTIHLPETHRIKPYELVERHMKLFSPTHEEGMPQPILFEKTYTGREIIYIHDQLGDDALYFGTEQDLRLYRIALVNMHLYQIPAHILYADPTKIDTSIDSNNWRQGNVWEPVNPDKLKQA